jgi:hypothetical protein
MSCLSKSLRGGGLVAGSFSGLQKCMVLLTSLVLTLLAAALEDAKQRLLRLGASSHWCPCELTRELFAVDLG